MKDVKTSRYNYFLHNAEGDLLIYNSLNYEFLKILHNKSEFVEHYLRTGESFRTQGLLEKLADRGIFVPEGCDEMELVHEKFIDCVNNDGILTILVVLTENCNMRCPYCFEEHKERKITQDTIDSIIKFVKRSISKYRGLYVYWFGGEPLMEVDTIEKMSRQFIEVCNFHKKTYLACVSTNGYYLTLETLKRLIDCNIISYQITVDGIAKTHNKFRVNKEGKGTFQVIMDNLCDIKEHMDYGVFSIDIRTNYTNEIYENIDEFIELLNRYFSGDGRFRIFPRTAVNLGGYEIEKMKENLIADYNRIENAIIQKFTDKGKNLNWDALKLQLAPGKGVCYAAKRNHFGIDTDGYVFRCSNTFQMNPECRIGTLENGKMHIDKFEEIKWIKSWESIDEGCKCCFMLPVCFGGGCALQKYQEKYKNQPKIKNCQYEKKSIDSILLLLDSANIFTIID